jgi:hypothetical protein
MNYYHLLYLYDTWAKLVGNIEIDITNHYRHSRYSKDHYGERVTVCPPIFTDKFVMSLIPVWYARKFLRSVMYKYNTPNITREHLIIEFFEIHRRVT